MVRCVKTLQREIAQRAGPPRPTEMVRDMRGMRGKSRGLVNVCIGWRPTADEKGA
jgi:hypothetical protein